MTGVDFKKVKEEAEIDMLAKKADIIWHEYFPAIISEEQIDYMVNMFLAPYSIRQEMKEGYEFYLLYAGEENIGFLVVRPEEEKLFISKLYVDKEHRGQGYGSPMFEKAKEIAVLNNLNHMYLTVNKYNTPSIQIYEHKGFTVIDSVETDIGGGFVMDDYIMELELSRREIAMINFKLGYNCSQAVVLAFADEMGIGKKELARISSSFGVGMGQLREVCGTVSGMFMAAGMILGYDDPKAVAEKSEHYARIREMAAKFQQKNGSIVCRELLGIGKSGGPSGDGNESTKRFRKKPCVELVGDAAEILEEMLKEQDKKHTG